MACHSTPRSCCLARMAFDVSSVPLSLTIMQGGSRAFRRSHPVRERHVRPRSSCRPQSPGIRDCGRRSGTGCGAGVRQQRVRHEVEAPSLVRILRDGHRCPRAQSPFATAAFSDRQSLFLVNPVALPPVHRGALPLQKQVQAAVAERRRSDDSSRKRSRSTR